ncbi:MAG: hypothetical protein ACK5JT_18945 [Hyphomicrobiaceae bacterium]
MSLLRALLVAVFAAVAAGTLPALAQSPHPVPLRLPNGDPRTASDGSITVSINYGMRLPLKSEDTAAQTEALEKARRVLYTIAGTECNALMATIAKSCKLARLSVNSNVRQVRGDDYVNVNGNASYLIDLK